MTGYPLGIGIQAIENNSTPVNSRQLHKQANKEKKVRTHGFNEVWQLPTSSGQKGKEILLINQLKDTNIADNTLLYVAREFLENKIN